MHISTYLCVHQVVGPSHQQQRRQWHGNNARVRNRYFIRERDKHAKRRIEGHFLDGRPYSQSITMPIDVLAIFDLQGDSVRTDCNDKVYLRFHSSLSKSGESQAGYSAEGVACDACRHMVGDITQMM
jgi:hypothetical protein